jgi:Ca2+-binding EF-hand superfamily protein
MGEDTPPEVEAVMTKLRASLKRRGAEGIRGLGRHFKICDVDKSGQLDIEEFTKCCRLNNLGLSEPEVKLLHGHFDRDRSGGISYDEFLRVVRGRLAPVRKQIVKKIFDVLDKIGGERGYLTIENIQNIYSVSKHPAVMAGKMTKEEALQEFLNSFEGSEGNRDGKVTLDEWVRHYEEVSASIDNDDYFGQMMSTTWSHLKQKMPDGSKVPAVKFTPRADVDLLEKKLRTAIYAKTPPNTNQRRTAELAFKSLDSDGSGGVSVDEFIKALERFGMHVQGMRPGVGGLPKDTVQALFNKYDTDGSGNISYKEFTDALYADEEPKSQASKDAGGGSLTGKTCYKDNEWLKGSNGIFDGIFGGGGDKSDRLRPPKDAKGIGGNFQRGIGSMG